VQDDSARINGLMAVLGKKETENKALRDTIAQLTQPAAQEAPNEGAGLAAEAAEETPQWEPGTRLEVDDDGQLVEYEPTRPMNPNENNWVAQTGWNDRYGPRKVEPKRHETGWPV